MNTDNNALEYIYNWLSSGQRAVLITLVGVDGSFPRYIGTQMAVSETGDVCGFISNGCLDEEIKRRAQDLIVRQENELVRYGKGSKYIDIVLPCGSGIDLYFDQSLSADFIEPTQVLFWQRKPFKFSTNLETGVSRYSVLSDTETRHAKTVLDGSLFTRFYQPKPRILVYGDNLAVEPFVRISRYANFYVQLFSNYDDMLGDIGEYHKVSYMKMSCEDYKLYSKTDMWTAAVLLFHDPEEEMLVLKNLLRSKCFYVGIHGSVHEHEARAERLLIEGFTRKEIGRLKNPIGLIPEARNRTELAISTYAEIVACAKQADIQC